MNNKILIAGGFVLLYLLLRKKTTPTPVTPTQLTEPVELLNNAYAKQGLYNDVEDYTLTINSAKPIQVEYIKGSKANGELFINVKNIRINQEFIPTYNSINGIKKTLKLVC